MSRGSRKLHKACLWSALALALVTSPAMAAEFMIGTLAYSYVGQGYSNVFVQGQLSNNIAWTFDYCEDTSGTRAALLKRYNREYGKGSYWFTGLIHNDRGMRQGLSLAGGVGYEFLLFRHLSLGAYGGGAASQSGELFAVFDLTLGYSF